MRGAETADTSDTSARRDALAFFWNGKRYRGRVGDTIASALWRQGVRTLGCSRKRHRHLGLSGSYLQGVLVTVGGRPHARADEVLVSEGLDVRQQNVWPSARWDVLGMFRFIPARWVRGGFEHPRLLPGGTVRFALWERLLMFLAGEVHLDARPAARAPPAAPAPTAAGVRLDTDVLVVGGGPAGRAAANAAAAAHLRTALVSSSLAPGTTATLFGVDLPAMNPGVQVLAGHSAVGIYRDGSVVLAAPLDPARAATVIVTKKLILATGRRSLPPLVAGHDVPGVLEVHTAVRLASQVGRELGSTVVVGDDTRQAAADTLTRLGVPVVAVEDIGGLERIEGKACVSAARIRGRNISCRTLVHAGPYSADPSLRFQATAGGTLRLLSDGTLPANVEVVGAAALPDEVPHVGELECLKGVAVCPCMDATVDEVLALIGDGELHVEVLKRATSCGMGPCQGFPCWELLRAVIRAKTHGRIDLDRPTHRPPRRGLTVEQAAGLDGLLELH
jgi:NADPH-dependent 2,4-dienoyl-CoA reductase/sulfur reductase-like enzyme